MKLSRSQQIYLIMSLAVIIFLIIFYISDNPTEKLILMTATETSFNDYIPHKLINITFKYVLHNDKICKSSDDILSIFIVTSYFGNVETRSSMRRAFNSEDLQKLNFRRVFLLGQAPEDHYTTQQSIEAESKRFHDIIQGNFTEAYRNLTYKHVMGLKWAATYCPSAKYVIKMDDDTVLNMYKVKTILDTLENVHENDFIAGYKLNNMRPIREPANKWYVTQKEYSGNRYPTFVSGWFYVTNPQTSKKLSIMANYQDYFWIDDVLITGILANKLKVKLYDISKFFVVNAEFLQCCLQDFDKDVDCDFLVGPNGGDNNMFYKFNTKVRRCSVEEKCSKRIKPLNETCVAERKVNLGKGNPIIKDFRLS